MPTTAERLATDAFENAQAALARGDSSAALIALAVLRPLLGVDRALDRLWLEALRRTPAHPTLEAEVRVVLGQHALDAELVMAAAAALIAAAELRAADEPPLAEGPAMLAASAVRACLDALTDDARRDPERGGYLLVNLGGALRRLGPERDAEAVAAYEEALRLDPSRAGWWFGLGVCHKWRGRWQAGLDASMTARAHLGAASEGARRPVLFNAAICATALGQGAIAAEAYGALGLPVTTSAGGMPALEGLPRVEVRVPTRGSRERVGGLPERALGFEVVRVAPLSPCHGVVETPTFRDAPVDYGDVILWDAAPVSVRQDASGVRIPCFPLLEKLRAGDERRFRFLGLQQAAGDVERLGASLPEGTLLVVQEERIESVCPRCAAGELLMRHEHQPPDEHRLVAGKLIAPAALDLHVLRDALDASAKTHPGVFLVVPDMHEALGDTAAAGKARKAWSGLERTGRSASR